MSLTTVLGVCLQLASTPTSQAVFVPAKEFTLVWNHSIEKVRWEEDYEVILNKHQEPTLIAKEARIKGSAAGMEPPPEAQYKEGWYYYQPTQTHPKELRLTRSEFTPDYDWCVNGKCQALEKIFPTDNNVTLLTPCLNPI